MAQFIISLPSTSTVPPEIVSIELNTLSKVVLPDPEGPMTATNSPFSTEKLILLKLDIFVCDHILLIIDLLLK